MFKLAVKSHSFFLWDKPSFTKLEMFTETREKRDPEVSRTLKLIL